PARSGWQGVQRSRAGAAEEAEGEVQALGGHPPEVRRGRAAPLEVAGERGPLRIRDLEGHEGPQPALGALPVGHAPGCYRAPYWGDGETPRGRGHRRACRPGRRGMDIRLDPQADAARGERADLRGH